MRLLGVAFALIASASAASVERPADVDDFVLVRGSIHGCPGFPGVLAHQKVNLGSELHFFDLDPIPIYGQTADQIHDTIANRIADRKHGEPPSTLRVEIIRSSLAFKLAQEDILDSYRFLAGDPCLHPRPTRDNPFEQDRELRRLLLPHIAYERSAAQAWRPSVAD